MSSSNWAKAQEQEDEVEPSPTPSPSVTPVPTPEMPQMFFDARNTSFTKEGGRQVFDGDVIALGPGIIVTADRITSDQARGLISAEGHVILLLQNQLLTGSRLDYFMGTGDFRMKDAAMSFNDSRAADRVSQEILGFSPQELEFEVQRNQQINSLEKRKENLRGEAKEAIKKGREPEEELIKIYARELERENLIRGQENPFFSNLDKGRRENFKRRREFWSSSRGREYIAKAQAGSSPTFYYKMAGSSIERTNGNDYKLQESYFTPCYCEDDETPPWAFRSSGTEAQQGGYATFHNPVLEIKGVPILYLPFMRVPIKHERQSGFLMPTFVQDSYSGTIYSQPVFLDLGKNADATVKTDVFEKRGTRIGTELRYQHRKYSGFKLNVEGMRDRLWMDQRALREDMRELYLSGLDAATSSTRGGGNAGDLGGLEGRDYVRRRLEQRDWWTGKGLGDQCLGNSRPDPAGKFEQRLNCEETIENRLQVPENVLRGKGTWQGLYLLTDRLSVVTHGEIFSDRHYNADLYIPEGFQTEASAGRAEPRFYRSKLQTHYDEKNYYLGAGSLLGDNILMNNRYEGQQMPLRAAARTRTYQLTPSSFRFLPLYGNASTEMYRISYDAGMPNDPEYSDPVTRQLGGGQWRQASVGFNAPLVSKSAIQTDFFSDMEGRQIELDHDDDSPSTIGSYKLGVRFQLPIDGKGALPNFLSTDPSKGQSYGQHLMNWSMTLTARPIVVRRGPYGEEESHKGQAFFATDKGTGDDPIDPTDNLSQYQLVTFATRHRWKFFNRGWQMAGADADKAQIDRDIEAKRRAKLKLPPLPPPPPETYEERARRELLYTFDKPVRSSDDILNAKRNLWFINRYQLTDSDYTEPVNFSADISYDYLKEQERKKKGSTLENRPWKDAHATLGLGLLGYGVASTMTYNIYDKVPTNLSFDFSFPTFFRTAPAFTYLITNNLARFPGEDRINYAASTVTKEKIYKFTSSLIDPIYISYLYADKLTEGAGDQQYRQALVLTYLSPTRCWALSFGREKEYGEAENDATYVLQLAVVFMGEQRPMPNMSRPITREIRESKKDDDS